MRRQQDKVEGGAFIRLKVQVTDIHNLQIQLGKAEDNGICLTSLNALFLYFRNQHGTQQVFYKISLGRGRTAPWAEHLCDSDDLSLETSEPM